ncbi:MAG: DNA polymerase III subunit beta, partial [Clostridia bacterium]|nr:DNA polymerase III subunit beta [Clostridia bacterium]
MKFTCAKSELSEAIAVCSHAVSLKSTDQILGGILFSAAGETVTLTGYNLKIGITKTIPATVVAPGSVVIIERRLIDMVRKMPGDEVTITVDENLSCKINCGATKFTLTTRPADEFPAIPTVEKNSGIKLSDSLFKQMIDQTVFAVSNNENKPTHTGALFEVDGDVLIMCAVDGYRLATRSETVVKLNAEEIRFIVPGDSLKEISRILPEDEEECVIYTTRKFALFEFADVTVITRLLEGDFINFRAAIPKDQPISLKMDRQELISA